MKGIIVDPNLPQKELTANPIARADVGYDSDVKG
jgi:hypothetical protein